MNDFSCTTELDDSEGYINPGSGFEYEDEDEDETEIEFCIPQLPDIPIWDTEEEREGIIWNIDETELPQWDNPQN
jgi:hypothetical protein